MRKKEAGAAESGIKPEKPDNLKDHGRRRRNLRLTTMAAAGILECILAGEISGQEPDRMITLVFLGVLYSVIFFAGMEFLRTQKDWFYEKAADYKHIARWYTASCIVAALFLFLPEYARPVMLLAIGMDILANSLFGVMFGMFHVTVFAVCGQENAYILLCGMFLVMGGCMAVSFLEGAKEPKWEAIFLFLYVSCSVLVFSFLQTGQLEWFVLFCGACNGACSAGLAGILCQKLRQFLELSRKRGMDRILHEDFSLVQAVQNFSKMDYGHAKKVSEISKNCAAIIGADPDVAAAGGFYYRIGRMEGEPYVENGVALAKSNHLPKEIIEILQEYNGEQKFPSTLESAIVHIVDSVVAKFDVLDKETLSSSWNQDILVYQTLNENSASGLYDKSGFSMNMFLKIRDYLIKEAKTF